MFDAIGTQESYFRKLQESTKHEFVSKGIVLHHMLPIELEFYKQVYSELLTKKKAGTKLTSPSKLQSSLDALIKSTFKSYSTIASQFHEEL